MFADAIDEFPKRLYWQKGHSLFGFSSIPNCRPIVLSGNRRLVLQRNVLAHFVFIGCDISFCNAFPYFILSKVRCCALEYHAWYFWGYKTWLKTVWAKRKISKDSNSESCQNSFWIFYLYTSQSDCISSAISVVLLPYHTSVYKCSISSNELQSNYNCVIKLQFK